MEVVDKPVHHFTLVWSVHLTCIAVKDIQQHMVRQVKGGLRRSRKISMQINGSVVRR